MKMAMIKVVKANENDDHHNQNDHQCPDPMVGGFNFMTML